MKLKICVYLHTKFQVSSIILTSFRQRREVTLPSSVQSEPLKSPPRLGLSKLWSVIPQLSQNRPRLRCLSSFLKNFFKYA